MAPDQASQLRVAIHRLVRAEREYAILNSGSRAHIRRLQHDINKLIHEATNPQEKTA